MSQKSCDSQHQDEILCLPGGRFPGLDPGPDTGSDCEDQRSHLEDDSVFDEQTDGGGVDREAVQSGSIVAAPDSRPRSDETSPPIEETTQDIRGVLNEKPPITVRLVRYYRYSKQRIKRRLHGIKGMIRM